MFELQWVWSCEAVFIIKFPLNSIKILFDMQIYNISNSLEANPGPLSADISAMWKMDPAMCITQRTDFTVKKTFYSHLFLIFFSSSFVLFFNERKVIFTTKNKSTSCRFLAKISLHFSESSWAPAWCNHLHASQWEGNFGFITPLKPPVDWVSPRVPWPTGAKIACEVALPFSL